MCKQEGVDPPEPAEYDVKTTFGPHGYLCQAHYDRYGMPLGTKLIKGDAKHPTEVLDKADALCKRCGKNCPDSCWNKETGRYRLLERDPLFAETVLSMGLSCEEV